MNLFDVHQKLSCSVARLCLTLLWPVDYRLPGSSVLEISSKSTGVTCHFLLQEIFPTQASNPRLLHWQIGSLFLTHQRSAQKLTQYSKAAILQFKKIKKTKRRNGFFPASWLGLCIAWTSRKQRNWWYAMVLVSRSLMWSYSLAQLAQQRIRDTHVSNIPITSASSQSIPLDSELPRWPVASKNTW